MPPKAPLTSIECYTSFHLQDELAAVQDALSVTETEETWDSIASSITRFAALCNGNANKFPSELVAALRSSSRPINSALNSDRTRLSGTATDFVTTAATALGGAFEPLIPHYLPTLFVLCTKANKVFVNRAKACIAALVEHTGAPMIIHFAAESAKDKSVSLRLAAAETLMSCMKSFNPPDLEKEARAKEIEAVIRSTAVDANADVRKVARKIFDAYKILLPNRLQSFTDPLTPRTRKYLDIKGNTVVAPIPPRSQPPSRPTSSQSVNSTQSESRAVTATQPNSSSTAAAHRPTGHVRSRTMSQTTSMNQAPPRRPLRAPTPEIAPASASSTHDTTAARRPAREEPRRLKVDMPPPDYIPTHTGPQRPQSATELHFPSHGHAPSERAPSGPQRVMRPDATTSTTNGVRSGPMRPPLFNLRAGSSDDGAAGGAGAWADKKERVVGGARRVLRMPEPEHPAAAPSSDDKDKDRGNAAARPPVRPRVISTSRSTPAVPLHAAPTLKEVKKLASSLGPSSKPGSAPVAKVSRTASASAATAPVSQGGVRARSEREKDEKATEKRVRERTRTGEKVQTKEQEKERERTHSRTSSKATTAAAAPARPAPTVTMRDKTNRVHSRTVSGATKASEKDVQKPPVASKPTKSRSTPAPEVPEVVEIVSPAEVPLPETPKVSPAAAEEPVSVDLICLDTPEQEALAAPESAPEEEGVPPLDLVSSESDSGTVPLPVDVPLPSFNPNSEGTFTPPEPEEEIEATPVPPAIDITEPRTPEERPRRRAAEVEQTPISSLVASIQRGFLSMHGGSPLPPMIEEEDSMMMLLEGDEEDRDERVFGVDGLIPPAPLTVKPLFAR